MISVSPAFATANALLNKQPIFILQIDQYPRAFSTHPGLSFPVTPNPNLGSLVGAFTDAAGNVKVPLAFGNGPTSYYAPPGATQLQLGVNDDQFGDNLGSWVIAISVNGGSPTNVTVAGTSMPWTVRTQNTSFDYGKNDGTAPTIAVTGLNPWDQVTVTYVSGTVNVFGGFGFCDANGLGGHATGTGVGFSGTYFPSRYIIMAAPTVYDWITDIGDLKQTINDLEGSSNLSDLVVSVQDRSQAITGDMPGFVFEGKAATFLAGFVGLRIDQYATLFTGVINTVESDNYNLEYKFTIPSKNGQKFSQTIYTTGDNGISATDSKNPKSLNGHPLDMFVSACQQCGIADIDTAKIYYYRDTIFNGLQFTFSLDSAPTAKDFIENELMKPLGMYWRENNLGTITIQSFYPALSGNGSYTPPSYPQATETVNTITYVPVEQIADLVDQVTVRFDQNGNGFDAETVQQWNTAVTKYGLYGGQIIESKGMRSSFQGYYMAAIVARLIFLRYAGKQIVLDPLPLFWSECIREPGDIIAVTLAFLPDRQAGVLGITTKAFEVLDRNWKFMEGICQPKLLEINLSAFKQFLITPDVEPDYAADTAPNQAKYMYLCDAAGKYSTGAAANTLG